MLKCGPVLPLISLCLLWYGISTESPPQMGFFSSKHDFGFVFHFNWLLNHKFVGQKKKNWNSKLTKLFISQKKMKLKCDVDEAG